MSRKQVNTNLEGYDGPIFIEEIDDLNTVYDAVGASGASLEEIGKTIEGFIKKDSPSTKDGYGWFWSLHFKTTKGEIAVLFPWAQDWDKHNGIQLDRSIAIYRKGDASFTEAKVLLERIQLKFYKIRAKQLEQCLQEMLQKAQ